MNTFCLVDVTIIIQEKRNYANKVRKNFGEGQESAWNVADPVTRITKYRNEKLIQSLFKNKN